MRILILTCNTGQGHNSSAVAIREVFDENEISCDIVDALSFLPKGASQIIDKCFTGIYRHMPRMFDKGYSKTDIHIGKLNASDYLVSILLPGAKRLRRFIDENQYTHVICVHIFSAIMVSAAKDKYGLSARSSFLPTDYTCYPFMEKTNMDLYFLPHEDLRTEYIQNGVPQDKLVATGIPVRRGFLCEDRNKEDARRTLALPIDAQVIFLMGGSMGCGPIEELVQGLIKVKSNNIRLLVSCGTNEKLFCSLKQSNNEKIVAFRYSDNIPQIMTASDLFITKPGGISITESAVMGLPMLLLNFIGGCETPNFDFFKEHGYAFSANSIDDAVSVCDMLLSSPERLNKCSESLYKGFYKDSAKQIYKIVTSI